MQQARQAREAIASAYRTLVPDGVRRELWHLRHTGRTSRASQPSRYEPYAAWDGRLPTRAEAQASVARWRQALADGDTTGDGSVTAIRGKASIIVVTYNNLDYTRMALKSVLEKTVYPDYELLLVDNGSAPDVQQALLAAASEHPNVTVVLNGRNLGFAAANNAGIQRVIQRTREYGTPSNYIVLLNNDVIVTPGWLTTLIRHLDDERIGMVGPVTNFSGNQARIRVPYRRLDEIDAFAQRYTHAHAGRLFEIPVLAMYCVALRQAVVDEIGPLDERFGAGMFEDDDYALRVREAGYRVVCAEDVFIHHFGRASFSKLPDEAYQQLFEQNKRLFEQKWGRTWAPHRYRPYAGLSLAASALIGASRRSKA